MEIKVGKKGKIILKAEDGEFIRIVPKQKSHVMSLK